MNARAATIRETARSPELLSLKEVAVVADVREARLRKDIENGLLDRYVTRRKDGRLGFHWSCLVIIAAVYGNPNMPGSLRKVALNKIGELPVFVEAIDWPATRASLDEICRNVTRIKMDSFLSLDLAEACEKIRPDLDLYLDGLGRIEERPDVLGGEAVFRGSRLPVAHVGKMFDRGEAISNLIEDYPYLTERDIQFAQLYGRAHPPVGRPSAGEEAVDGVETAAR